MHALYALRLAQCVLIYNKLQTISIMAVVQFQQYNIKSSH